MIHMEPINQAGDEVTDIPGVRLPLHPIAKGRLARHSAIADRIFDLIMMDHMETDKAIRKALDELDPHDTEPKLTFLGYFILGILIVAALSVAVPAVAWIIGNVLVPIWYWGFGWSM
jgi:hypothetical protein